jgi:hypothetical protein
MELKGHKDLVLLAEMLNGKGMSYNYLEKYVGFYAFVDQY